MIWGYPYDLGNHQNTWFCNSRRESQLSFRSIAIKITPGTPSLYKPTNLGVTFEMMCSCQK